MDCAVAHYFIGNIWELSQKPIATLVKSFNRSKNVLKVLSKHFFRYVENRTYYGVFINNQVSPEKNILTKISAFVKMN